MENRSSGRHYPEPQHGYRGEFQRDRDRIIHSTAFRRLVYKTQVFVNHEGDHYRTRLTHSLEVAQIARTVARSLELNEQLVEAICLAHDLGHTPFGHAGQDALNLCMSDFGGFEHNLQSLRVVDELQEKYASFPGLNLMFETREGILKHCSKKNARSLGELGLLFIDRKQPGLEAQLANLPFEMKLPNVGTIKGTSKYTYIGPSEVNGRKTAKLTESGDVSIELETTSGGAKVTGSLSSTDSTSTIHVDPQKGWVVSKSGKTTLSGNLTVEAGGQIINIEQTLSLSGSRNTIETLVTSHFCSMSDD